MAATRKTKEGPVALPVPLERWFNDTQTIEELRAILASPAFQAAAATLKEIAGPSYGNIAPDPTTNSNYYAWYAGYRDGINDLHKLTKTKGKAPEQPEAWSHIQTPQQ